MKNSRHATHLARHLALLWTLLIAYASLHPLGDFRGGGGDLLGFLSAPWPRYWTRFDVIANALGYLPLGFLLVPAASPWLRRLPAFLLACLLATGLSIGLEVLQHYLPTRVPSNLDVASNALGAACGALLGARWCCSCCGGWRRSIRTRHCSVWATCAGCSASKHRSISPNGATARWRSAPASAPW